MQPIKSILAVVMILMFINVNAQKKRHYRDSTTVIVFSQSSTPLSKNIGKKSYSGTNIVKIAPLGILSGVFPVYFERGFGNYFSLQAGIGITGRNYFRELLKDYKHLDFTSDNNADLSDALYTFDHRTAKPGFMFSIQPRYYEDGEGIDGYFGGIGFNSATFNFEHQEVTSITNYAAAYNGGTPQSESEHVKDIFFVSGYQTLDHKISFEATAEMGIRLVSGTKYVAYSAYDNTLNNYVLSTGFKDYSQTLFYYNIGIKIGYHF
jgi:hypothetical protein